MFKIAMGIINQIMKNGMIAIYARMAWFCASIRPNPLNEMEAVYMNWSTASKTQLLLITSKFEDCPLWLKTEARAELMRRQRQTHTRIQMRRKEIG